MTAPPIKDVLAEVNRLRAERGMEPLSEMPKGTSDAHACPLANALGVYSVVPGGGYFRLREGGVERPLPPLLRRFGVEFDQDAYPELDASL